LIALLKDPASDATILNDASYELADKNLNLDLAEASALKALEDRTKVTAALTMDVDPKTARAQVHSLLAVWDTIGWIYFREHKLDAAEDYLRAAWLSDADSATGLHLGQVQEARGQIKEALETYDIAQAAATVYNRDGSPTPPSVIAQELSRRIEALRHKGVTDTSASDAHSRLQKMRTLRIGPAAGRSGTTAYTVLMANGHVEAAKMTGNNPKPLRDGDAMVKRIVTEGWWPKGSEAKMLRQGFLNCHSDVCEFVLLPL
jgi:hypothetical protein